MARSRVGNRGSNQRRIKQRDEDSDESDEEYKVTDEDFDESDECYSLDGDESEEISADFGKSKRVSRSRKTRRSCSGKKVNGIIEPRKRRRVCYTEDDDEVADEDDADFTSWDREANQANKPVEKKRILYTEVGDDDDDDDDDDNNANDREEEDYKDFVFSVRNKKQRTKPREKKRVIYTEDEDGDGDEEVGDGDGEEEEVADEDDGEFMSWDREANQVNKPMERKWDSFTEVDDDDDDDDGGDDYKEFVSTGRSRKQRTKPREKKRVVYSEDDDEGDDDEEKEVADEDDAEFTSFSRKANQIKTPTAVRRDSYTENDDDEEEEEVGEKEEEEEEDDDEDYYEEFVSSGRKRNQRKKPPEKKVDYTDEDDAEFGFSGRKRNQRKKRREKVDYTEDEDYDDAEFVSSGRKRNQRKKPQEKKFYYTEDDEDEDEDDTEFVSSGRKRTQRKKPQETKVDYTEDEDDVDEENADDEDEDDANDDEYMYSDRKVNNKKNLRGKSEVSYEEDDDDDDDDSGFISTSGKRNQINKRREKRIVSYKEDEEEEEDENDAEFKLSESDFVDDEDETPMIKKNKGMRSHPQKKSVRRGRKKSKKSKTKNTTKPKQRNQEKSTTNKTKTENRSKISKKRKQRAMAESDSDFVNSASSDHEYTVSEEEREQMREARVLCANLRAKLRSSSCGNQEKQPAFEQKKYPMRKGKEKIEDVKDDIGKQVCGICLSEEHKRTMRGVLNCCRHYFCFACIMEWSKVESRCPLCKQRFTTITKAAKSDNGFDLRTVVIPVPECDQVYEPSEEELRGYLDPYENVICTECQNGGDDALMLLCDICDSSAHTFCVGLGQEVPEGNWYCEGCRPTVFGTQNSDRRLSNNNASDLSSPSPIPGGFDLNELYVPETPMTQQTRVVPEPNPASTGTVATTLRERRRLHRQRHHQLLNNNRMNDLVGRPSGPSASSSSSGIRLFGSQLDQARVSGSQNDHIFSSMHEPSNFYPRTDQFPVQVHNSSLASADVALPEFTTGICTDPPVH